MRENQAAISEMIGNWKGWADKISTEIIHGDTEARVHAYFRKPNHYDTDFIKLDNMCNLNPGNAFTNVSSNKTEEELRAYEISKKIRPIALAWALEKKYVEQHDSRRKDMPGQKVYTKSLSFDIDGKTDEGRLELQKLGTQFAHDKASELERVGNPGEEIWIGLFAVYSINKGEVLNKAQVKVSALMKLNVKFVYLKLDGTCKKMPQESKHTKQDFVQVYPPAEAADAAAAKVHADIDPAALAKAIDDAVRESENA